MQITDFEKEESFIQINTIKGFKYIDRAGEIVNFFHTPDNKPPRFNMNLQGLVIFDPVDNVPEFKIAPDNVWAKFRSSINANDAISFFTDKSTVVLKILEVTDLSRIGWRTVFVYEFRDEATYEKFFRNLIKVHGINEAEISSRLSTDQDFKAHLRLSPGFRIKDNKKILMFDIDVYKEGNLKAEELKPTLIRFWDYVRGENGFFRTVNSLAENFCG